MLLVKREMLLDFELWFPKCRLANGALYQQLLIVLGANDSRCTHWLHALRYLREVIRANLSERTYLQSYLRFKFHNGTLDSLTVGGS